MKPGVAYQGVLPVGPDCPDNGCGVSEKIDCISRLLLLCLSVFSLSLSVSSFFLCLSSTQDQERENTYTKILCVHIFVLAAFKRKYEHKKFLCTYFPSLDLALTRLKRKYEHKKFLCTYLPSLDLALTRDR